MIDSAFKMFLVGLLFWAVHTNVPRAPRYVEIILLGLLVLVSVEFVVVTATSVVKRLRGK